LQQIRQAARYAHANQTDKPRRVLATIYLKDGTTCNGASHVITIE
jgi:hypothetical protein